AAAGDQSGTGTGTGTYIIPSVCMRAAPSVSISPTTQLGSPGTQRSYTATITNNDSACASGTFAVTRSAPAGWTSSVSPTSVTLASGASTTVTLNVTPSSSAVGSNSASVTASNAASGTGTGS